MQRTVSYESTFTEEQVQKAVHGLRKAFKNASNAYWEAMKKNGKRFSTFVMRDKKTLRPTFDNGVDYTLYHAQIDFAYIIDDLQRGPACLASGHVKKANDLIATILAKTA